MYSSAQAASSAAGPGGPPRTASAKARQRSGRSRFPPARSEYSIASISRLGAAASRRSRSASSTSTRAPRAWSHGSSWKALIASPSSGTAVDQLAHPPEERVEVDGLGEVPVGAGSQPGLDVGAGLARGDEKDREAPELLVAPDRAAELEAVDPGHVHVEEQDVRPVHVEAGDELHPVGRLDDLKALQLQRHRQHLAGVS